MDTQPEAPTPTPPKPFPLLPVLLSLFSLLLLLSTGFLAYQNMQLTKQITSLTSTPIPSPTPNENNLPQNTFDICGSAQPKTRFSIMPPTGWTITKNADSEIYQAYRIAKDDEWVGITCGTGFGGGGCLPENDKTLTIADQNIRSCISPIPNTNKVGLGLSYLDHGGNTFAFSGSVNNEQAFTQILSTFKFTDQIPTPTCIPRPACLDATPRCMIPETSDMCPKSSMIYTCPPSGYVDCMPIMDETKKKACSPEAMSWYEANCPNFQGGAL